MKDYTFKLLMKKKEMSKKLKKVTYTSLKVQEYINANMNSDLKIVASPNIFYITPLHNGVNLMTLKMMHFIVSRT